VRCVARGDDPDGRKHRAIAPSKPSAARYRHECSKSSTDRRLTEINVPIKYSKAAASDGRQGNRLSGLWVDGASSIESTKRAVKLLIGLVKPPASTQWLRPST